MASLASSAPLPQKSAHLQDPQLQELVRRSRVLVQKILNSIPDTHTSCIHTQTLRLNSSENSKLTVMASNIGIPSAPVLRPVSEKCTLETSLTRMSDWVQMHRALLNSVLARLETKDKVTELMADIKDLAIQINKMLKLVQTDATVQPTPTPVALRLPGEYEVQVAAHLVLVQLQSFGQDMVRCLRDLDDSNDEETDN